LRAGQVLSMKGLVIGSRGREGPELDLLIVIATCDECHRQTHTGAPPPPLRGGGHRWLPLRHSAKEVARRTSTRASLETARQAAHCSVVKEPPVGHRPTVRCLPWRLQPCGTRCRNRMAPHLCSSVSGADRSSYQLSLNRDKTT
jgi:hypothetical protein